MKLHASPNFEHSIFEIFAILDIFRTDFKRHSLKFLSNEDYKIMAMLRNINYYIE